MACAMGTVVILALRGLLIRVFIGDKYMVGMPFVFFVCLAQTFLVIGSSILPFFLACKQANSILLATLTAALIDISLNILLLPKLGILASAAASLAGYLVWSIVLGFNAAIMLNKFMSAAKYKGAKYDLKAV